MYRRKTIKKMVHLTLPVDTYEKLLSLQREQGRSLANTIMHIIEVYFSKNEGGE